MKMWITDQIIKELKKIDGVKITNDGQGGDVDTSNLYIEKNGYGVHVAGFITTPLGIITSPDSCEIEMVEVSDGRDSRGGCNADTPDEWFFFGQVQGIMKGLGYTVVNQMKDYF